MKAKNIFLVVYLQRTKLNHKMERITLEYDGKNVIAKKAIDFILSLGVFKKTEVSPYDPDFVERIRKTEKEESHKVDLGKYGINV